MSETPSDEKPSIAYAAQARSPMLSGDVKLTIGKNSFTVNGLFDIVEMPFVRIDSIAFDNNIVNVNTEDGAFWFSKMGQWGQAFYDALCISYGEAVLRSFFVSGKPVTEAKGDYNFIENGSLLSGKGRFSVYEDCVVALPSNGDARRIPLCFAVGMDKKEYELALKVGGIDAADTYIFSKLGHGTDPFVAALEKQIRAMQERTVALIKDLDPSLSPMQASQISKLIPNGVASPLGQIASIAPSFRTAFETAIAKTHAAESYNVFKELCGPDNIWAGFKKKNDGERKEQPADTEEQEKESDVLCWMIAPSPDGRFATVEFAEPDTATFVYKTDGDVPGFAAKINRSLEAISFKREAIRLSDEDLLLPENADCLMAAKRWIPLRFIRSRFHSRIIHSSPEAWKRKLTEIWNSP